MQKSLRLPHETHFELPKTSQEPGVLTILTSRSISRAGVVESLATSTSKNAPIMPFFLMILTSKPFWRAGVVQILATSTSKSAPRL